MTIIELPRRARVAARLSGSGLVSRFLQPLLFSQRKIAGRVQSTPPRGRDAVRAPGRDARIATAWTADPNTSSNAPLESLAGGSLASRFHAWRGASGRRYICSVFPADPGAPDGGLPDFADAIAIAVTCDRDGNRGCISLLLCDAALDPAEREGFVAAGLAEGAVEWHIHLLTVDAQQRRAAAQDIEICCVEPSAV
jgi:hypothetical protein